MPRKRKASIARIEILQVIRDTLPDKRWKPTPADSELSESDRTQADKIVYII